MYMLFIEHDDGSTENIYNSDESKLWDIIDELRLETVIKQFNITEVKRG